MKKPKLIVISLIIIGIVVVLAMSFSGKKKEPERIVKNKGPYNNKGFEVLENDTIIGWILREKTVECKIEATGGVVSMKVKKGKIRVEGLPYANADLNTPANLGVDLTAGDTIYHWDTIAKKGVKIDGLKLAAATATGSVPKTENQKTWMDRANEYETSGTKYICAETDFDDDLFKAPEDVVFTEFAQ